MASIHEAANEMENGPRWQSVSFSAFFRGRSDVVGYYTNLSLVIDCYTAHSIIDGHRGGVDAAAKRFCAQTFWRIKKTIL